MWNLSKIGDGSWDRLLNTQTVSAEEASNPLGAGFLARLLLLQEGKLSREPRPLVLLCYVQ